jgi:hypothetical protein
MGRPSPVAYDVCMCAEIADCEYDQEDFDGDGEANACDGDRDGDGVGNNDELHPFSPAGQSVNADGCSGTQFAAHQCPQDALVKRGQYVRCVAHAANYAVSQGRISTKEKAIFIKEAAKATN